MDPPSSMHRLTAKTIAQHAMDEETWISGAPEAPSACVFLTQKPHCLYIGKLAVAEPHRGKGYARLLIDCTAARARTKGLAALEPQSRIELTEVHATLARMRFVKTGENAHDGYTSPTSITMRRELN